MDGEAIFGTIIMMGCGFGCGAVFYFIGVWAARRKDPMHFWSGSTVDPGCVSDIPAYNQANSRMWKIYSVPYWLTGLTSILIIFDIRFSILSGILIGLACTVGIGWLLWEHNRIEKKYIIR